GPGARLWPRLGLHARRDARQWRHPQGHDRLGRMRQRRLGLPRPVDAGVEPGLVRAVGGVGGLRRVHPTRGGSTALTGTLAVAPIALRACGADHDGLTAIPIEVPMPTRDRNLQPVNLPADWSVDSWRARPAAQLPTYPDPVELEAVLGELKSLPPLVTSWEILALRQQLAEAQEG